MAIYSCTGCIQPVHSIYSCTGCIQPVQWLYTACTVAVQWLYSGCTVATVQPPYSHRWTTWEDPDVNLGPTLSGARVRPRVITCARIMCARGRARAPARGDKQLSCSRSCNGVEDYYLAVLDPSMGILCIRWICCIHAVPPLCTAWIQHVQWLYSMCTCCTATVHAVQLYMCICTCTAVQLYMCICTCTAVQHVQWLYSMYTCCTATVHAVSMLYTVVVQHGYSISIVYIVCPSKDPEQLSSNPRHRCNF